MLHTVTGTIAGARRGVSARSLTLVALLLTVAAVPHRLAAQSFQGSTASTMGGIALGMYAGSAFGLVGSLEPCNRTMNGGRCAASGASVGGAMGVAMGGLIGAQNQDALMARLEGAGIGAAVGALVGVGLRSAVRQYGWSDVMAFSALGGAVGTAPVGAALGAGVGAAAGAIVWVAFPRAGLGDFMIFTLAGSALGGMLDWANGAATAKQGNTPRFGPSFSLSIR